MIRYIVAVPFLVFLIVACGDSENNNWNYSESGEVKQSEFLDTCQCGDLVIDSLGNHYKDDTLFTGICLDFYPTTEDKYVEKNLLNGRLHGKVTFFAKDGEILIEEIYKNGTKKRSGEVDVLTCKCSELEKQETKISIAPYRYLLDDIPYTGTCEQYYPQTNQLRLKSEYRDGFLHGHTIYYNRDGSTLLIEKYQEGVLMSVVN